MATIEDKRAPIKGKKEYDMMFEEVEGKAGYKQVIITAYTAQAERDLKEESSRFKKLLERVK